jgi:ABC-type multidrug transport system ATPase subunit
MEVRLQNLGKKFLRRWVFQNLSEIIPTGRKCAIVGYNGSGKSTLLQIISGARVASSGAVLFQENGAQIPLDKVYQKISIAAPYIDLVEELTLQEFYHFHTQFKKMQHRIGYAEFKDVLAYEFRDDQPLKSFSSGMKQRVKLAITILSETSLILLDEPCSNLDEQGRYWYQHLIEKYLAGRTLMIASNDPFEYEMTDQSISLG